ncbi:putative membrane protein [Clavispora lusitaniae]|uniref:Membrane protein n=1 Tax=Clavispora lusitaniae TaxID=36911 RepID=A0ACD0WIX7_CLALS|nr:putative membrane protein [Clavispora lusitaniae]QFZ33401.1 putative membrane protein [Clavispora lusitaniae]QFZ39072.1 putative membrane protein [Clavispora lusitaniae]QFZ44754.1 putative membrane protein [Clavispora lusitaniae]QFZ50431.1 putative membrane protein [Clavispora lusitaniae]
MGALISLPCVSTGAITSICGAITCFHFCNSIDGTIPSAIMTRLTYAFVLMVNSLMSWVAMSPFIVHKIEKMSFGFINYSCGPDGKNCIGFSSVHRINLALGTVHLILAAMFMNMRPASHVRLVVQNGCWKVKLFAWAALLAINFVVIPDSFFIFYGNHIALIFSTAFLGVGLILLVDFAHAWAETCLEKIELEELTGEGEYNAGLWKKLLVGGTLAMYVCSIVLTVIMYIFFAAKGCSMNQTAISINLVLAVVISVASVNQSIQESNPNAGLAQASMVVLYCTYLVLSAVVSEPDDKMCNPLVRSRGTRTLSVIMGALFTFVALAYTTTRAANSTFFEEEQAPKIDAQPSERAQMRYQAIKQAVDEGSLPQSALNQVSLYDEDESRGKEKESESYNYTIFHIIFFLATQYISTLLTINVKQDDVGDFIPVGRTYFSSWVKIISSWVCYVLYGWSLVAPMIWPDRFSAMHL